jgi:hypothetical protein
MQLRHYLIHKYREAQQMDSINDNATTYKGSEQKPKVTIMAKIKIRFANWRERRRNLKLRKQMAKEERDLAHVTRSPIRSPVIEAQSTSPTLVSSHDEPTPSSPALVYTVSEDYSKGLESEHVLITQEQSAPEIPLDSRSQVPISQQQQALAVDGQNMWTPQLTTPTQQQGITYSTGIQNTVSATQVQGLYDGFNELYSINMTPGTFINQDYPQAGDLAVHQLNQPGLHTVDMNSNTISLSKYGLNMDTRRGTDHLDNNLFEEYWNGSSGSQSQNQGTSCRGLGRDNNFSVNLI